MSDLRLKNYALTAGSAAAMATAGVANAGIVSSSSGGPVSVPISASPTTLFTVGGETIVASNLESGNWFTTTFRAGAAIKATNTNAAQFTSVSTGVIIDADLSVSDSKSFGINLIMGSAQSTTASNHAGGLAIGSERLLALAINNGSEAFYGWINYTLSYSEGSFTFSINDWAYNDVADQGIIAGQPTAAGSSVVPGLGGLAALAIGAAGVRSRRQRVA
jgi:hypothetical protein